jgi:VWFA-related protein
MLCDKNIRRDWLLVIFAAACCVFVTLSGCGGGGGDDGGGSDGSSYTSFGELDVAFSGVVVNHFADDTLTLKNAGSVALTLGQIEAPDAPFTIEDDQCSGTTLGESATCDIQVRFSPTSQGSYSDAFVVPLSGSDTAFATVNLEGDAWLYNVSINQFQTEACPDVRLIVSVTNSDDSCVTGLDSDDFVLLEEGGTESGTISLTASDVIQGASSDLSVVLALDTSGSVGDVVEDIIAAAKNFINDMKVADEAAVFQFASSGAEPVIEFTTATADGKTAITTAIDTEIDAYGGGTALYTAVSDVCDYIVQNAAAGNRTAIIVITDGQDTASEMSLDDAVSAALEVGVPIFTIGSGIENAEVLQALADDTGGQYYDAPETEDINEIYLKTSALFSNQYEIEYTSSLTDVILSLNLSVMGGGTLLGNDSRDFESCSSD